MDKTIGFLGFSIIILVGLVFVVEAVKTVYSTAEDIDDISLSGTESFVYTSPETIDNVGQGITSLSVTTPNQTWLDFDGVNDYVNSSLNVNTTFYGKNWTISIWAKPTVLNNVTTPYIYFADAAGGDRFYLKQADKLTNITIGLCSWNMNFDNSIYAGQWTNYIITMEGNTSRLYVNGTLKATQTNVILNYPNAYLLIGGTTGSFWNGSIDKVVIYDSYVTLTEVSEIYKGGRT